MAIYRNQTGEIEITGTDHFLRDVIDGLGSFPKHLDSKYFYDKNGDEIFQQIMDMPTYYLTDCEKEIISTQKHLIFQSVIQGQNAIDFIDFGPGDGIKSLELLGEFYRQRAVQNYLPIDISGNVISVLEELVPKHFATLPITGFTGDYLQMLPGATSVSGLPKLVCFLGANIGNFTVSNAQAFLKQLSSQLKTGDLVLIGIDLKKDPQTILDAYNDREGITAGFNLNLLKRINRELGGDFNVNCFSHYASYDPLSGSCKSYLISAEDQEVTIDSRKFNFSKYEPVSMEVSQKYSLSEIDEMCSGSGFKPVEKFLDQRKWFADVLWEVV